MALEANLFLVMWVAMMVAMMFPSVYPMVLLFARVSKRQSGPTRVSTGTHLGVYGWLLAIWTVVGGIMYTLDLTLRWMGGHVAWFGDWATVGIAIILIGVGLYQLSAWKGIFLTHCRSPLSFVLHKWRQGKGMPQHQGHACVHTAISQSRPGAETVDGHHWGMLRGEWELKLTSPTPPIVRGLFRAR
jgi:predicted metal-binding membrane protein